MKKNDNSQEEGMLRMQILQNNMRSLQQKEQMLLAGIEDLEKGKMALDEIKNIKGEAYVPIGANNFVLGKIEDSDHMLVPIGSGIAVKKKRSEALAILEERLAEFQVELKNVARSMNNITTEAINLQSELEKTRK